MWTKIMSWVEMAPANAVEYAPVESVVPDNWRWDQDLRIVTCEEITPEVIEKLENGAPYKSRGNPDEQKYASMLSVSITEALVDKARTPHIIRFTDTEFPVDPFIGKQAKPLKERATSENELLEDDPLTS